MSFSWFVMAQMPNVSLDTAFTRSILRHGPSVEGCVSQTPEQDKATRSALRSRVSYRIASHMLCIPPAQQSAHHHSRRALDFSVLRGHKGHTGLPNVGNRRMLRDVNSREDRALLGPILTMIHLALLLWLVRRRRGLAGMAGQDRGRGAVRISRQRTSAL
jgi:hypothetical protein